MWIKDELVMVWRTYSEQNENLENKRRTKREQSVHHMFPAFGFTGLRSIGFGLYLNLQILIF